MYIILFDTIQEYSSTKEVNIFHFVGIQYVYGIHLSPLILLMGHSCLNLIGGGMDFVLHYPCKG